MTLTSGRQAENFAVAYLSRLGFEILAQNWRTKFCEIDIVARRAGRIHFVEVKYRSSDGAGKGVEYITPQKLRQMERAAQAWVGEHEHMGDYQLDVVTVDGDIKLSNLNYIQNVVT